jgi:hypothetical protein
LARQIDFGTTLSLSWRSIDSKTKSYLISLADR